MLRLQEMVRGSEGPGVLHLLPLASILEPWRSAFREAPAWQPSPLTAHSPVRNFQIPSPFRLTWASSELPSSNFMRRFASSSIDRDGATLDPAELAQTLDKSGGPWTPGGSRSRPQEPDGRQLLLRPQPVVLIFGPTIFTTATVSPSTKPASFSDAGFVEGRNVVVEYRWAEGRYERLPGAAVGARSRANRSGL
jgi:hypothetical protein